MLLLIAHLMLAPPQAQRASASPPSVSQAGPPPPAPAFDVEPFRFLIGRWRGSGSFFNGKPVTSEMVFRLSNRTTMEVQATEDAPNIYRYVGL